MLTENNESCRFSIIFDIFILNPTKNVDIPYRKQYNRTNIIQEG